jgi:predicted RNA polymerase sigma factor
MSECSGINARDLAEQVARRSYGKLIAYLAARTRDLAAAEDALSDAFASALDDWPRNGCPKNPEGWLMTVARRKFLDAVRSARHETQTDDMEEISAAIGFAAETDEIPDRRLGLMFACAHPAIDAAIRAPLMLQTILGLDAARIASAFLISPATMGQRLVRAKNKIRQAGIPLEIPEKSHLQSRLDTVLDAIYATFSEGWIDATGADVARRDLAEEAIYLGRVVVQLLPDEPEGLGLLALMLYAESRRAARRNEAGDYIPLAEQNPTFWNLAMIVEAEALLQRAGGMNALGRYQLEAAIQSAHAARVRTGRSDWSAIVQLYDALLVLSGSPVAALNRALAIAALQGPQAAIVELDLIANDPRLADYQPYWAARAELLARVNSGGEARHAYDIAIGLERDPSVRRFLEQRRRLIDGEMSTQVDTRNSRIHRE